MGLGGTIGSAQGAQTPRQLITAGGAPLITKRFWTGDGASCAQVTINDPPEAQRFVCWGVESLAHPDVRAGAYLPNLSQGAIEVTAGQAMQAGDQVAIGQDHICLTDAQGLVWCYGERRGNRIGDGSEGGSTPSARSPVRVAFTQTGSTTQPAPARQLVTNNELTCAVLADASVWCWGTNRLGVLSPRGVNDPHVYQTANRIEAVSSFAVKSMALSAGRACAIAPAGSSERQLVCWGDDRFVRTARTAPKRSHQRPSIISVSPAQVVAPQFKDVQLGGLEHTSGVAIGRTETKNQLYAWGKIDDPQTPERDLTIVEHATLIDALSAYNGVTRVATSGNGLCFVNRAEDSGRDGVFCYGLISPATDRAPAPITLSVPTRVGTLTSAASLACGKGHCCAIESGQALCWGNSDWLQTGSDSDLPVPLDSLAQVSAPNNVEFVQLALGSEHSCAIVRDRVQNNANQEVVCWGRNQSQQFGVLGATGGQYYDRSVIAMLEDPQWIYQPGAPDRQRVVAESIAAGSNHNCVIASGGAIRCWGDGALGQLGTPRYNHPQRSMFADIEAASLPAGMEAVVSAQTQTIAADSGTTCYITATPERVACFGGNESGVVSSEQILPEPDPAGSNSTNYQAAYVPHWPQALEGDAVTQLSLHRGTGCATHRSGALVCWGDRHGSATATPAVVESFRVGEN